MKTMLEYRYDTQLLIDGDDLDEDEVAEYFTENFKGDCLLAVGGDGDPIIIPTNPGRFWSIAGLWARSTILSWRIWIVSQEG